MNSIHESLSGNGRGAGSGSNKVMEFIRAAEKFMSVGKYSLALDQLLLAQKMEPKNQYIGAIIERAEALRAGIVTRGKQRILSNDPGRFLSVTVGKEFEHGIRQSGEEAVLTPQETRARVLKLVESADALLGRGQSENAFEALMKAYLLDPCAPEVIACEGKVLPVWELSRKQRGIGDARLSDQQRMDLLKGKKQTEQNEIERAAWHEPSPGKEPPGNHSEPEDPFATSRRKR
jgi:hypothetical protein